MKQIKERLVNDIISEIPNYVVNGTMCLRPYFTDSDILNETEKAVYIQVTLENASKGTELKTLKWIPKSCIEEIPDEITDFQTHIKMLENTVDNMYPYGIINSRRAVGLLLKILGEEYTDVSHNAYINIDVGYAGEVPGSIKEYNEKKASEITGVWAQLREMLKTQLPSEMADYGQSINNAELVDRFSMANSIDSILNATQDVSDGEKAIKYERGNVYVRVGYVFYDATVVIGTTDTGRKFLVDIININ